MTTPPPFFLANASGTVTGTHVAAVARLSPIRALGAAARAQWYWVVAAGALAAAITALELWDDGEVRRTIQDWDEAARLLGGDQLGASLDAVMPAAEDWTFDDRAAFDASILQLRQEIDAIIRALEANKEALEQVSDKYREAIDGLVAALVPILLAVIASIVLQAFPPTNPLAMAIGVAGASATVFILAQLWSHLDAIFEAGASFFRSSSAAHFVGESRPGWADPSKPDPDIRDIVINYTLDPSVYKK